jgi:hypothetical protein
MERSLIESPGSWRGALNQCLGPRYSSDSGLRFGINVVLYALTQEGSLTRLYVVPQ